MADQLSSHSDVSALRETSYNEFVALLARHDHSIRRFIRSLLPSSDGVDDVMQEVALECWKKFADFGADGQDRSADGFIRWACVIARYKVLSWQRDQSRDRLVFRESVIERLADAAVEPITRSELERTAVERCLAKLQDTERRLILSLYSPGESVAQIARETSANARQVYSKVNVLRQRLLECVQHRLAQEPQHG